MVEWNGLGEVSRADPPHPCPAPPIPPPTPLAAPAIFLGRDAVMSTYACGKSTAVVVDIGGSSTTITPVFEGWVENTLRSPVGGNFMDDHFLSILDKKKGKIERRRLKRRDSKQHTHVRIYR